MITDILLQSHDMVHTSLPHVSILAQENFHIGVPSTGAPKLTFTIDPQIQKILRVIAICVFIYWVYNIFKGVLGGGATGGDGAQRGLKRVLGQKPLYTVLFGALIVALWDVNKTTEVLSFVWQMCNVFWGFIASPFKGFFK